MTAATGVLARAEILFEEVVAGYLDDRFVERDWLAERVIRHFNDPKCRFVLLTGPPGVGKSAFLASLTRRLPVSPRYFIRRHSIQPLAGGDAWSLLLSVGHQLAVLRPEVMRRDVDADVVQDVGHVKADGKVIGVRIAELRASPFHRTAVQVQQRVGTAEGHVVGLQIERMITDPRLNDIGNLAALALLDPADRLARIEPGSLVVVLIDALDELRFQLSAFGGRGNIVDWLAECPELPPNVRVVVTARAERDLLRRFRLAQAERLREETIASTPEVTADLERYAERLLSDPDLTAMCASRGIGASRLARRAVERAAGNFLYLTLWGRALRRAYETGDADGVGGLTDLTALPSGLDGIYEYFLVAVCDTVARREGETWRRVWRVSHRPLLGVLAVAQSPLTVDRLARLCQVDEVRAALADIAHFLEWEGPAARLCHTSLAEFLMAATGEDWHVEPAPYHHDIAQRLIDRYGGSWQTCDDEYALANTAIHLVGAVRAAATEATASESAALLARLLAAPDFAVAKAKHAGVDEMLTDYVATNAALRERTLAGRPEIADGLATVLARLAADGTDDLTDTLHAVLGYRRDAADLYEAVLRRLSDPGYLAGHIPDDARRAETFTGFTHVQATRLRRTGDPDNVRRARELLERAATAAGGLRGNPRAARLMSSVLYDLGYLNHLAGAPEEAIAWLRRSVAAAEEAGDRTGAYISRLVALRTGLLAGTVEPGEFRGAVTEALAFFGGDDTPHAERWTMNCHAHLLDLAMLTDDAAAAEAELEALEDDPWTRRFARTDHMALWRARAALVTGAFGRARDLYEERLRDEMTDPPPPKEELARELYDYGRALLGSGDPDGARRVWRLGLRCPDNAANWPWKPRISRALDAQS